MENNKSHITIYFEGKVIESNAESIVTIGNTYHLKSEEDGQGKTIGMLPCDKVVIIFNRLNKPQNA
jgi:hypothetical protein